MLNPKISIVIPFYNCPYVSQAIESALNQTYRNIEIILINDGSTMHMDKIKPYLNRIRYIEKGNGGTATALNTGIYNATGEYISWLSSDDIYLPDKTMKQVSFMRQFNAHISYSSFKIIDKNSQIIDPVAGTGFSSNQDFYLKMLKGCIVNGCTTLISKRIFETIGVFDESLKYAHDYDLWVRILFHYQFYYLNDPILLYRAHDEMGSVKHKDSQSNEALFVQNKYRYQIINLINQVK